MVDTDEWLEITRDMGDVVVDLLSLNFASVSHDCPIENGPDALREDPRYGATLDEIEPILDQFGEVTLHDDPWMEDHPQLNIRVDRFTDGERVAALHMPYQADGAVTFIGELYFDEGIMTLVDHMIDDIAKADVGRYVARAELAILSNELGSTAEALDYWAVEESGYRDSEYYQSEWAKARGVSRQAVSNNLSSSRGKLPADEPSNDDEGGTQMQSSQTASRPRLTSVGKRVHTPVFDSSSNPMESGPRQNMNDLLKNNQ